MIKPIYLYGAEVLRRKADEADLNRKDELRQLLTDLQDTLTRSDGCGLAAPQIGVSQRVLIVDGDPVSDTYSYLKGFKRTMINPVIVSESDKRNEYSEGCLSVPGVYADVVRPAAITVEYYNEQFEKVREEFDKFAARMVQHEMSHLDGVLFTDLLPPIRRKMLAKKLGNISHGKVSTAYNTKTK